VLEARKQINQFALGWNEHRLLVRIADTCRFARMSSEHAIGAMRRQRIPRLAAALASDIHGLTPELRYELEGLVGHVLLLPTGEGWLATKLLRELDGLSGVSERFRETLERLGESEKRLPVTIGRGGDRRSGERKLESLVMGSGCPTLL
jgi:hypothetical protein